VAPRDSFINAIPIRGNNEKLSSHLSYKRGESEGRGEFDLSFATLSISLHSHLSSVQ
jgi:hypothetical protein